MSYLSPDDPAPKDAGSCLDAIRAARAKGVFIPWQYLHVKDGRLYHSPLNYTEKVIHLGLDQVRKVVSS